MYLQNYGGHILRIIDLTYTEASMYLQSALTSRPYVLIYNSV